MSVWIQSSFVLQPVSMLWYRDPASSLGDSKNRTNYGEFVSYLVCVCVFGMQCADVRVCVNAIGFCVH